MQASDRPDPEERIMACKSAFQSTRLPHNAFWEQFDKSVLPLDDA